jgi:methionyl-tRNA synthetase
MMAKYLITSALPYANGAIHIGHLAGAYLPADVFTRYLRLRGHDVHFLSGSDEHGVPITIRADSEGTTPRDVIDRYHNYNEAAFRSAGIEFDIFGRTSWPEHVEATHEFFRALDAQGHIEKGELEQFYSPGKKQFLPDRYVEGTCPRCGADGARGDQCDACGATYEASELVNPKSKLPGDTSTPELRKTTHWFLRLSDFEARLKDWLETQTHWRPNVLGTALAWVRDGLRTRCITRDTTWGVSIPVDDADRAGKSLYVWFDAPIGYVTNSRVWAAQIGEPERWKRYWQDDSCWLYHFIGKDNIPFHAVIFPAMLIGTGGYNLPYNVVSNEFLNFGPDKFSKSRGNVIEIDTMVREFGQSALRFYLTHRAPETADQPFTWEDFQKVVSTALVNDFGNAANRCISYAARQFDGKIPPKGDLTAVDREFLAEVDKVFADTAELFDLCKFRQASEGCLQIARAINRYVDEQAPWKAIKTDRDRAGTILWTAIQALQRQAVAAAPIIPQSARVLAGMIGAQELLLPGRWDDATTREVPGGADFGRVELLFVKLDDERVARVAAAHQPASAARATAEPAEDAEPAKPKKAKKGKRKKVEPDAELPFDVFARTELRVGKIVAAEPAEGSDKLLKIQVDIGKNQPQTIVSGIAEQYEPAALIGRRIAIVANLAPAKFRGHTSHGMLLVADGPMGEITLLTPDGPAEPGAPVH